MKILDKILFAQDFSATSAKLQTVALQLAKEFKSTVVPIHILPKDINLPKVKELLHSTAQEKLEETRKNFKQQGIDVVEPILKYGTPYELIAKGANTVNASVVLVGSGESTSTNAHKLGTTTERLIQYSAKPVLVLKEGCDLDVRTILCPIDFSSTSERALTNALLLARRFKAKLIIQSVSEKQSSSWFSTNEMVKEENEERLRKLEQDFDSFLKNFTLDDLNWTKLVAQGDVSDEILKAIETNDVDLLVMGSAGRTGLNRLIMGSVTEKVIREVPCSFITLKSEDLINRNINKNIKDFELLIETADQLEKDGFYEEAIEHYRISLTINAIHLPAYSAIARLLKKTGQEDKANAYRKSADEIKERIWYKKIEDEVRELNRR
jgi:universal stress protein E